MPRAPRPKIARPLTTSEKLSHLWGAVFVAMVVVLTVLLVGKGCFGG